MDQKQIERLKQMDAEIMQLEHISALLQWDEEIQMPSKELEGRSDQISLIQGMIYDRKTSTEMGEVLDALDPHKSQFSKELTDAQKALIRLSFRDYERQEHIPKQLITELSKVQSRGQAAWARARETASFVEFQPHLERIVNLKREWADAVGYGEHPYDPLIDEYEPGMTTADVEGVFEPLAASLVRLMDSLPDGSRIDDSFLYLDYPKDLQDQFG
ncbi:MAG: carboxypeptidase M32, partial [Spirochaetales bacterium]|nr:carboxypeptidase M32 [Spirochaetales bacterium]